MRASSWIPRTSYTALATAAVVVVVVVVVVAAVGHQHRGFQPSLHI